MKEKEVNVFCKSTEFEYASRETGCHCVRTTVIEGEPWFVAKDVAEILGYTWNATKTVSHVPGEWLMVESVSTIKGDRNTILISEQGLYFFLGRSDKPAALPFQKWIAGEILPTIRKTGGAYLTLSKAEELLADPGLVIGLAQQVIELKANGERLTIERDHAIKTKAHISDKKTATAMGKLGGSRNANRILKEKLEDANSKLGIAENYKQVRAIGWIGDVFNLKNNGSWVVVGQALKKISDELGYEIKKVPHEQYPKGVNIYHVAVIEEFRKRLDLDPDMLAKYRISSL